MDSTAWLDTLSASDSAKEITANENFDAASPATLFGRHASACSALTWAYYGGRHWNGTNVVLLNNGTLSLTNNATNYIEATTAGVVSSNTSGFTAGRIRIAKVVTASGAVSSYEDHRAFAQPSPGGGTGTVTNTGGTLTANALVLGAGSSDTKVAAGLTSDGTSKLTLGVAGSSVGAVELKNATSGSIVVQPPTGALGSVTVTVPDETVELGFRNIPQNSKSAAYTTVMSDGGKHILHPSADTTARTFTIDSNANVAYPVGTAITFVNQNSAGVVTIAITSDTMRLAGAGTTGNRTLAANGVATALKIASTEWIISGTGLT